MHTNRRTGRASTARAWNIARSLLAPMLMWLIVLLWGGTHNGQGFHRPQRIRVETRNATDKLPRVHRDRNLLVCGVLLGRRSWLISRYGGNG